MSTYRRIKDLREDNDLTQTQLAEYLNISQRDYSHYEIGDRTIPIEVIIQLADFYKTSIDYLVGRINQK